MLIVDLTYTYNDINFDELPLWPNKIALAIQQAVTYPTWLLTIGSRMRDGEHDGEDMDRTVMDRIRAASSVI